MSSNVNFKIKIYLVKLLSVRKFKSYCKMYTIYNR